ncbi:MAG: hypothetical protein IJS20_06955, partial [Bacteroidales bacterium]|nr:hypothetical protein [Bacteroidales bacterium]
RTPNKLLSFFSHLSCSQKNPSALYIPAIHHETILPRRYALLSCIQDGFGNFTFLTPSLKRTKKNQKRKEKERKKNATTVGRGEGGEVEN